MIGSERGPYWNMLFGSAPRDSFVEIRYRLPRGQGMGQRFFGVRESVALNAFVDEWGARTDVYVGVLPRAERRGSRDAIPAGDVLYVDCDDAASADAASRHSPAPSMVVASGHGLHLYWALDRPLEPQWIERANRRLAHGFGADMKSTDAARILRPPGTFNFKHGERLPVTIETLNVEVYSAADIVGDLPDPPAAKAAPAPSGPRPPRPVGGEDAVASIPPREYVEVLTGRQVGGDGKISCPLPDHEDRTPSCQVYDDPERGWYCFGCGRGGTIYDFAAALWGLDTRGEDFKILRRRISERLLNTPVAA